MEEEELKPIELRCEKIMSEAIDKLVEKLDDENNAIQDSRRKKEIINGGIRLSLNKIANRIDRGFNYEVRMPVEHKREQKNDENSADEPNFNLTEAVQNMQFLKTEGDPVLFLGEKTEEDNK